MCQSIYYHFWDTARYLWKNRHFYHTPLHSTPPLGGFTSEYRHPLWDGKTRMVSLYDDEKILKISLFVLTWSTNMTDRQTDRHCVTAKTALASHRAVKTWMPILIANNVIQQNDQKRMNRNQRNLLQHLSLRTFLNLLSSYLLVQKQYLTCHVSPFWIQKAVQASIGTLTSVCKTQCKCWWADIW